MAANWTTDNGEITGKMPVSRRSREAQIWRGETSRSDSTPTDMAFLDLLNRRLDHVRAYCSPNHYRDYRSMAKRWVQQWGELKCREISRDSIQAFVLRRAKVSPYTSNKELRSIRATFNHGVKRAWIDRNPTQGIEFPPEANRIKYVPPLEDIEKLIAQADPDTRDYLWTIQDTMARVGEINALTWEDVNLERRYLVLYTRKKRGSHLTARKVPLTDRLHGVLSRRYRERDPDKQWVFWHEHFSRKEGRMVVGPYGRRKRLMKSLCEKAGVRVFQFHALRHSGASLMENHNVPIGAIQKILGHSQRLTTEIYLHNLGSVERDAIAVFERVSRKSLTPTLTP